MPCDSYFQKIEIFIRKILKIVFVTIWNEREEF